MDSNLSDDTIKQMVEDVDENGDGVIDYEGKYHALAAVILCRV